MSSIRLIDTPVVLKDGIPVSADPSLSQGRENTIAYKILRKHEKGIGERNNEE